VGIDTEFVDALIEREGCPNYWTETSHCSAQIKAEADCDGDPRCRRCFE
jgi:hypothetical protein